MNKAAPIIPPSPQALERVSALAERRLSAQEFNAYVNAPMSEAERREILDSVAWFTKTVSDTR